MQHLVVDLETGEARRVDLTPEEQAARTAEVSAAQLQAADEQTAATQARTQLIGAWVTVRDAGTYAAAKPGLLVLLRLLLRRVFALSQEDVT